MTSFSNVWLEIRTAYLDAGGHDMTGEMVVVARHAVAEIVMTPDNPWANALIKRDFLRVVREIAAATKAAQPATAEVFRKVVNDAMFEAYQRKCIDLKHHEKLKSAAASDEALKLQLDAMFAGAGGGARCFGYLQANGYQVEE